MEVDASASSATKSVDPAADACTHTCAIHHHNHTCAGDAAELVTRAFAESVCGASGGAGSLDTSSAKGSVDQLTALYKGGFHCFIWSVSWVGLLAK